MKLTIFERLLKQIFSKEKKNNGFLSLKEIEKVVDVLALKISSPTDLLPTFGYSKDFAHPHIEVTIEGYNFVVLEKGQEVQRKITQNLDEILYWIFDGITFSMALKFEVKNRIESQDCRWVLFQKQDKLLGMLNILWQQRSIQKHSFLLKDYIFNS